MKIKGQVIKYRKVHDLKENSNKKRRGSHHLMPQLKHLTQHVVNSSSYTILLMAPKNIVLVTPNIHLIATLIGKLS